MSLSRSLNFITSHPLCRRRPLSALARFAAWQFRSRVSRRPYLFRWIDNASLIVERGMVGGTGNLYVGLHEYPEMGFLLHFLRPDDLFIDIGANVGSYTVLASGVCGARSISFEPVPETFEKLRRNVTINCLNELVDARMQAVGARDGVVRFTTTLDSENHVLTAADSSAGALEVPLVSLTSALAGMEPTALKMDVEGFETAVFEGGERVFQSSALQALIVELNGCGNRYGYSDQFLHQRIVSLGFQPAAYDPRRRRLSPAVAIGECGNVLYIRDFDSTAGRVASAPLRVIHSLNATL